MSKIRRYSVERYTAVHQILQLVKKGSPLQRVTTYGRAKWDHNLTVVLRKHLIDNYQR